MPCMTGSPPWKPAWKESWTRYAGMTMPETERSFEFDFL
jgi:hypothetical protein